jgi:hypothetical protein
MFRKNVFAETSPLDLQREGKKMSRQNNADTLKVMGFVDYNFSFLFVLCDKKKQPTDREAYYSLLRRRKNIKNGKKPSTQTT